MGHHPNGSSWFRAVVLGLVAACVGAASPVSLARQDADLPPLPPEPRVGEPAPPLSVERILRSGNLQSDQPSALEWSALRGKVVVVEFWATWCAPCIGAIPHLNHLVAALGDGPVVFVSISDEEADPVDRFLTRMGINGVVALDTDRSVFLNYRVGAIPHTVVIDGNGIVRAITQPRKVTEAMLRAVIEGREWPREEADATALEPPSMPAGASMSTTAVAWPSQPTMGSGAPTAAVEPGSVLYEVSVRLSHATASKIERWGGELTARGCTARDLIAECAGVGPGFVMAEGSIDLDELRYDVTIRLPDPSAFSDRSGRTGFSGALADVVERALGIETVRDRQIIPVVVVRPGSGGPSRGIRDVTGTNGASSLSWGLGTISGVRQPMSALAERLGAMLRMPVADETGMTGVYDWTVKCPDDSFDAAAAALQEQLGLRAEIQTRRMDVVVVRRRL
ncbi:MAG: TIGR03435 family protein [Phycisphaeraceae bacterium]|nr:TIGR03435 family protein [Phycisphaerae bacterium]MBX3391605.1 TIGR03435 family protein [Phycisphaeraceae bacterium]